MSVAVDYADLREEYLRASKIADQARQVWAGFLPTAPLHVDDWKPPTPININRAFQTLVAAEDSEHRAERALFLCLRGTTQGDRLSSGQ